MWEAVAVVALATAAVMAPARMDLVVAEGSVQAALAASLVGRVVAAAWAVVVLKVASQAGTWVATAVVTALAVVELKMAKRAVTSVARVVASALVLAALIVAGPVVA